MRIESQMDRCLWRWFNVSRIRLFLSDRLGWPEYLKPFMEKPLPDNLNWTVTLGSVLVLLFVVEAATGMLLAMYYNPSPDFAYKAVDYIMEQVFMGRILRGIHHWGASAMVIIVFTHLMTCFFYGAFKPPREITWMIGVCLFLLTLGFGFTGYLLPWDQKAYWATVVGTNIPRDIPVIGQFITKLLLGGETVSGLTLTRFYAIHTLILPALTAMCIGIHIYLVRIHGISEHDSEHPENINTDEPSGSYRFFPEHLSKASIAFTIVFSIILMLSLFAEIPREEVAGTIDPDYLPRPEWYYMWLFQLLTFFSGKSELIGSLVIPASGVALLFCLPFLSRSPSKSPWDRPIAIAISIACLTGIVYLSIIGISNSKPYGEIIRVPDRKMTSSERSGLQIFADRECAYCHHILGVGGRREGPDLSNVVKKGRTREWLMDFIKDPQAVSPWSIMPKYNLDKNELSQLADFMRSLDFKRHGVKTLTRKDLGNSSRK